MRHPIYVISKGRADACLTAKFLVRDGVQFSLVVEPQERAAYAAQFGDDRLLVLPFSNLGLGSIPARNWVWEHAKAQGAERHWILDDNIRQIHRSFGGKRFPCDATPAFQAVEDFTERYENIAIAGLNYHMFGLPNNPPFVRNVHVYSCLLIKNDLPYRWRGRYNEDTDLCLQVLSNGWCTVLVNVFLIEKMRTMTMKGGNSDQLYVGDGRLKMARSLERNWPYVVTTERRFHRPQHVVKDSWRYFDTPLKLKPDVVLPSGNNEYGMALKPVSAVRSPVIRKILARYENGESGAVPVAKSSTVESAEQKTGDRSPMPMLRCGGGEQDYGKFRPWVWSIELVRGCNLACWHCPARLFEHEPKFMSLDTWGALCEVMARVSPNRRLELAQCGEATLHPHLLECLRIVRKVSPTTQVQVTTNGLNLQNGRYNFKELFDAGANSVYVDMYAPFEKFKGLVEASGAEWYHYNRPGVGNAKRKANTYYGDPKMRLIILQDNPHDRIRWRKMGRMSTFLNHIDWKVAMPFGLVPVRDAYQRKCTFPLRYVSTTYAGDYLFCCTDFLGESTPQLGNVKDGTDGFASFWFGRLMQTIRRRLVAADRAGIPYCARCNCAFSKCDWTKIWPEDAYDAHWDGKSWAAMPEPDRDDEVFADGWEKARALVIPTQQEEDECLRASTRRLIHSRAVTKRVGS